MRSLLLFASVLCLCLGLPAAGQELVVEPGGPLPTITEAVALARPGDRILVRPGVYREAEIVIDRPLTLVGEGLPTVDGGGQEIFVVRADSVALRGFRLQNVETSFVDDRAAVKVEQARGCVIEGNRFEDTFFGIYLAESAGCRIADNTLRGEKETETRSGNGIHLWYSRDVLIEGNDIRGHRDGIYFEFVEDSRVAGNHSAENLRYGLHFMFSDRCAYHDNAFVENDAGVAVMYTERVEMRGNRFARNWGPAAYGLLLKDITDSTIEDNVFFRNTIAVYAEGSNRMRVAGNDFVENGWAVKILANSTDNTFRRNNFVSNTFDVATNSRQNYSTFAENYWDAYRGHDLDRDGYGDVPFRPVRLFALIVEQNEPALLLMRSFFVDLLDAAERVLPVLTPRTLIDERPAMRIWRIENRG